MTEKTEKPLDTEDIRSKIDLIVDQLTIQNGSREVVTSIVDELSSSYGLKKPLIRKVATAIFKLSMDEENEANVEFNKLIDLYNKN